MDSETTTTDSARREAITGAIHTISNTCGSNGHRPRLKDAWTLLDVLYTIQKETEGFEHLTLAEFRAEIVFRIQTDSYGKIETLGLGHRQFFRLPPSIQKLEKLKELTLYRCSSVPIELGNLPTLESLEIYASFHGRIVVPQEIQLPHLKRLAMEWAEFCRGSSIVSKPRSLPVLEELIVRPSPSSSSNDRHRFVRILTDDNRSFGKTLRRLDLHNCTQLGERGLESLLFDGLPRFPNLRELNVAATDIRSLRSIRKRLLLHDSSTNNRLQTLNLANNPFAIKSVEAEALAEILLRFSEISSIGVCPGGTILEYLLRINGAGRQHVSGRNLPPGLWPTILDRASRTVDAENKCPTGIFYLLRNGSVLQDIVVTWQSAEENTMG